MNKSRLLSLSLLLAALLTLGGWAWGERLDTQPVAVTQAAGTFPEAPMTAGDAFYLKPGASFGFASCPITEGGRFVMQFTVEGADARDVIFSIRDSSGKYVREPATVNDRDDFFYVRASSGELKLAWDNGFDKANEKLVRWNYTIYPPARADVASGPNYSLLLPAIGLATALVMIPIHLVMKRRRSLPGNMA